MLNPLEEVLSVNASFYEVLATGDFDLMQKVWSNTDDVTSVSYTHLTLPTNREV